jgi:catechol 2,3-dioxygenase-like lactoylglutathione lyase family enzyme
MADERPVLNQLNLVARDFDATLAFYRRLGLDVEERSAPDFRQRHAEIVLASGFVLELDDEPLARLYNAGWRRAGGGTRALIGFSLPTREAVDRRYAELLAAGHAGRQPPYDTFWGARYAIVADPDGREVGLMSPPDERRRSWPPVASPDP